MLAEYVRLESEKHSKILLRKSSGVEPLAGSRARRRCNPASPAKRRRPPIRS